MSDDSDSPQSRSRDPTPYGFMTSAHGWPVSDALPTSNALPASNAQLSLAEASVADTGLNDAPTPAWVEAPVHRGPQAPVYAADFVVGDVVDDGTPNLYNNITLDDVREQTHQINAYLALRQVLQVESNRRRTQMNQAELDARMAALNEGRREVANPAVRRDRQISDENDRNLRRMEQNFRNNEQALATTSTYPRAQLHRAANEASDELFERGVRENAPTYLSTQHVFQHHAGANTAEPNSPAVSSSAASPVTAIYTPANSAPGTNRSVPATRRDRELDRALRNYRAARTALTGNVGSETNTSATPANPPYLGLLSQPNEQNNNVSNSRRFADLASFDTESPVTDAQYRASAAAIGHSYGTRDSVNTEASAAAPPRRPFPGLRSRNSRHIAVGAYRRATPTAANTSVSDLPLGNNTSATSRLRTVGEQQARNARTASMNSPGRYEVNPHGDAPVIFPHHNIAGSAHARQVRAPSDPISALEQSLSGLKVSRAKMDDTAKPKAEEILGYLSRLRNYNNWPEFAITHVQRMTNQTLARQLAAGDAFDLPLRVCDLPKPVYSSWLQAGMKWIGTQKGGLVKEVLPFDLNENTLTFREVLNLPHAAFGRREQAFNRLTDLRARERDRAQRHHSQRLLNTQGPMVLAREEPPSLLETYGDLHLNTLADVESHLASMLGQELDRIQAEDGDRWTAAGVTFRPRLENEITSTLDKEVMDNWPVEVTLLEVDMEKMIVYGTMDASQIPTRVVSAVGSPQESPVTNYDTMTTQFDGEIIDFATYELETRDNKPGYKIGGLSVDLQYWARLGPFKETIRKRLESEREKKAYTLYEEDGYQGTLAEKRAEYNRTSEESFNRREEFNKDEAESIIYNTMYDCLGSRKWLAKAMGEEGWIFMRWKERNFVSDNAPTAADTSFAATQVYTTSYTDDHHEGRRAWGLTIRGFYYVALNRMSGKIEALYYDDGSQPYQELACHPVGTQFERTTGTPFGIEGLNPVGLKTEFPSFSFR